MSHGNTPNPYQPTQHPQQRAPTEGADNLKAPGICLIVIGGIGLLLLGAFYAITLIGLAVDPSPGNPPPEMVDGAERTGFYVGFYGLLIIPIFNLIAQVVVIMGGIAMVRSKSMGTARTGAILSVIPCISSLCLLGIPFGIWALVALSSPQAKASMK